MKTSISLIVPTIGRDQDLQRLLLSLDLQTLKDFEVIVVDQSGSPEHVGKIIKVFSKKMKIKHIVQAEKGAARARNEGVKHASGEIIGWPDDDCWYDATVVEKVLSIFINTNPSVVFGCPLTESGRLYNRWLPKKEHKVAIIDIFLYGIEWSTFMKKDVFQKSKGFDNRIGPGAGTTWSAGESSDLCIRAFAIDKNHFYSPSIHIFHPQPRLSTSEGVHKAYRYAYGMGAITRKNEISLHVNAIYFWSYLRAFIWALIRMNFNDMNYHYWRIKGFIKGYKNYLQDNDLYKN